MDLDNDLEYSRLEELSGSDFEIADGQSDIKGWDVKNESGEVIGDVEELLFNPQTQKVRYIVVDTDANDLRLPARKILIPIGVAELHEEDDYVVIPQITVSHIETLPDYEKGTLTAEHEKYIRTTFSNLGTAGVATTEVVDPAPTQNFYEHEQFNPTRIYNRRKPVSDPEKLLPEVGTPDTHVTNDPEKLLPEKGTTDDAEGKDIF